MPKLSQYARERVVSLHSAGTNLTKIAKLLEEEGIKASRSAVNLFVSRYQQTSSFQDAKRSGRKSKLNREHLGFIDRKMKENDELTSGELKEKLSKECGVEVSARTIRRVKRNVLGWKSENARYCQFVRESNVVYAKTRHNNRATLALFLCYFYISFCYTPDYILICLSPNLYLMVSYFLLIASICYNTPSLTESVLDLKFIQVIVLIPIRLSAVTVGSP